MALVTYGPQVEDLRGKSGGVVFCGSKYGSVMRGLPFRANKTTRYTNFMHTGCNLLKQGYRALTQEQKNGWETLAIASSIPTKKNATKFLDGYSLFMKLNSNLYVTGATLLTDAPADTSVDMIATAALVKVSNGLEISWTPDFNNEDYFVSFLITPQVFLSINNAKPRRRFITTQDREKDKCELYDEYCERFGYTSIDETLRIHCYLSFVKVANGMRTNTFYIVG